MRIQCELSAIVYKLLLSFLLLTYVNALPFLFGTSSRDHMIEYQSPDDSWNITSIPRSIIPHLSPTNATQTHVIPPRKSEAQIEDELIKRLHDIKDNSSSSTGRMLWFDTTDLMHYPPFVDKTLKLFNLKQVAHELETSVMSKVSCTACKAASSAIECYQCNSAYDPRCGDPFDSYSLGKVNCSLKSHLEHLPMVPPVLCRKTTQKIFGKVRVVRDCGYLPSDHDNHGCLKKSGTFEVQNFFCSCTNDLCNAAPIQHSSLLAITVLTLLIVMLRFQ